MTGGELFDDIVERKSYRLIIFSEFRNFNISSKNLNKNSTGQDCCEEYKLSEFFDKMLTFSKILPYNLLSKQAFLVFTKSLKYKKINSPSKLF